MMDEAQRLRQRKLRGAARLAAQHVPSALPPVFFLTDKDRTPDPAQIAAQLPKGWGIIFRHRPMRQARPIAETLAHICRKKGLVFLVAASPALACALDADGVHWPERQAWQARRWQGRFRLMTASAHSRVGLARLGRLPVDAALRSVVFPSQSASAARAMGGLKFRHEARRAPVPVYGLGGVCAKTAGQIAKGAGLAAIDGIAEAFPAQF